MALITCGECLKEYSDQAKSCIHCGGNTIKPKPSSTATLLLAFLGFCVAAGMVVNSLKPSVDPQIKADQNALNMAMTVCQIEFEKRANDPKSVAWIREERVAVFQVRKDGTEDKATVFTSQPVRAKNKFGAIIKSYVSCTVINQNGQWNVGKFIIK